MSNKENTHSKSFALAFLVCVGVALCAGFLLYSYHWEVKLDIKDSVPVKPPIKGIVLLKESFYSNPWGSVMLRDFLSAANQVGSIIVVKEKLATTSDCLDVIEEFNYEQGSIVLSTSNEFTDCINEAAKKYPKLHFLSCMDTRIKESSNVLTFNARMYLMRYLSGILAAYTSNSSDFGYIINRETPEAILGVNAYTMGIKKITPSAKVYVGVVNSDNDKERESLVAEKIYEEVPGIEIFAYHLDSEEINRFCDKNSLLCIGYHKSYMNLYPKTTLLNLEWNWTSFFKSVLDDLYNGVYNSGAVWLDVKGGSAYLGKANSSIINLDAFNAVDREMNNLLLKNKNQLFIGPIFDNNGVLRVKGGDVLDDNELVYNMNWYVKGVEVYYE
ncbi:MAG: BMP family ABC transporter substrate-binding protein [Succinivibrionaceae bacterium]